MDNVKVVKKKLDLNLLQVFDVIYNSKSLTQASYSLGITQPAVSNSLARLRSMFNDKLFIRSPSGMIPTPLAVEIAPVIRQTLHTLEGIFDRSYDFTPEKCKKKFTLGMTDYGATVILPELIKKLSTMAPQTSIRVIKLEQRMVSDQLATGVIDLAFGSDIDVNADIYARKLYDDKFMCVARKGHPGVKGSITTECLIKYPHILFTPQEGEWGIVSDILFKQGLEHKTALYTAHAYSIPKIIAKTDYITIVPSFLADTFVTMADLQILDPPISIPSIQMNQFWHMRTINDLPNKWLREVVENIFNICPCRVASQ